MRVYSLLLALTCSRFALAAQARAACARGAGGAIALARAPYEARDGGVAERLKAHAWKVCMRETVSRVRIPPPPPVKFRIGKPEEIVGRAGIMEWPSKPSPKPFSKPRLLSQACPTPSTFSSYSIPPRPFIMGDGRAFGGERGLPGMQARTVLLKVTVGGHVGSSGLAIGCPVGGLPRACLL